MPTHPTYPGVYIEETPSGVRTITGVATSVTAFIGRAKRGPVNTPVVINSFGDFERIFGGLWNESTMSFAVKDFYLNGGSQAVIVRLFNPVFTDETARSGAFETAKTAARAAITNMLTAISEINSVEYIIEALNEVIPENDNELRKILEDMSSAASDEAAREDTVPTIESVIYAARNAVEIQEGSVGFIVHQALLQVMENAGDLTDADPSSVKDAASSAIQLPEVNLIEIMNSVTSAIKDADAIPEKIRTAAEKAVVTDQGLIIQAITQFLSDIVIQKINSTTPVQFITQWALNYIANSDRNSVEYHATYHITLAIQAKSKEAITTTIQELIDAANADIDTAVIYAANIIAPVAKAQIAINGFILEAINEGAWGNELRIRIDHEVSIDEYPGSFNLFIRDGNTGTVEIIRNIQYNEGDLRRVDKVLENESKLVRLQAGLPASRPDASPAPPNGISPWEDAFCTRVTTHASDGNTLIPNDYFGSENDKQGIYALEDADIFNLLCIPPIEANGDTDDNLWDNAATYCEKKRAMLIVDSPNGWTTKDLAKNRYSLDITSRSKNAALFFPRLRIKNPEKQGQVETFVPCGTIAGIMSRTDAERGIWKAPAGLDANVKGIVGVTVPLSDAENGELNPLGINCIRNIIPSGNVVWGSRTLRGNDRFASEWKYIPVRRTALYIEESLYRGLHWVVFEPNDEPLWSQIRLNVRTFMHNLFRKGAFQGTSPREAFLVKCDNDTTTQADIDSGVVNILVGFAPLKPAEFVFIKLQQLAGQTQS